MLASNLKICAEIPNKITHRLSVLRCNNFNNIVVSTFIEAITIIVTPTIIIYSVGSAMTVIFINTITSVTIEIFVDINTSTIITIVIDAIISIAIIIFYTGFTTDIATIVSDVPLWRISQFYYSVYF